MNNKEAEELFCKYLAGNCSPEELVLLKRAYNKEIPDDIDEISEERYREMKVNMWKNLEELDGSRVKEHYLWQKVVAAAILLVVSSTGIYFFSVNRELRGEKVASVYASEIVAGTNKAVLTLGNGEKIDLSSFKSGIEINASKLTYTDGTTIGKITSKVNEISAISTPRGGQYTIQLSDGTKVTLNSASILKFPSSFSGLIDRRVELAGEGYFEVAKDKKHPFIVKSMGQEVKVLGTHFNINCYADEASAKTTLVEGSVQITNLASKADTRKLKPGQQAELINNAIEVTTVNIGNAIAWKNGDFIFKNENIESVMRKLSRWYDIDIENQTDITNARFSGIVARSKNLSAVLEMLATTGQVKFKTEGRRIIIMR